MRVSVASEKAEQSSGDSDLAVSDLGETPYFVLSRDRLESNIAAIRSALPDTSIHYAIKANSEPAVLRIVAEAGCSFEVASLHELRAVMAEGITADRVVLGSAIKSNADIEFAARAGVALFAADSSQEVVRLARHAPGASVYFRIRVNDVDSSFPFSEKFGAPAEQAPHLYELARRQGLQPVGLSFHVGSQSMRPDAWADAIGSLSGAVAEIERQGDRVDLLNLGGGFPCQYATERQCPTIAEIGASISRTLGEFAPALRTMAEPGRFIIASAAQLVTTVIARVERDECTWLFTDAGCYNALFEAMSYQGSTPYPVELVRESRAPRAAYSIAGPTGDSPDVVRRGVELPADIDAGDRLTFRNVGAYTMSMAIPFNGFPKPRVLSR